MDYGIGMFLVGLVSGAGIGWYVAFLKIRAALNRWRHVLFRGQADALERWLAGFTG